MGSRADENRSGSGNRLQGRSCCHHLTESGVVRRTAQEATDYRSARLNAGANRKSFRTSPDTPQRPVGSTQGSLGVVFVCRRRPEKGDHACSRDRRHGATKGLDVADHLGQHAPDSLAQFFWPKPLTSSQRPTQFDEETSYNSLLPVAARLNRCSGAFCARARRARWPARRVDLVKGR